MSGYVGPPAGIGASPLDVVPQPNPLQQYFDQLAALHGVLTPNAPSPNPIGTSAVQTMGMPSAADDPVVGTRGDGSPILQSQIDAIHAQRAAGTNLALTSVLGMTGSIADAAQGDLLSWTPPEPKPNPLIAYHGTPYLFPPTETNPLGAFDLSKLGSGEGAQVYGHGMYVAENPETAASYRESVRKGPTFDASEVGGPDEVDPGDMADHVRDLLYDHPDTENVDQRTIGMASDYVVHGLARGQTPENLIRYATPSLDNPDGRMAILTALDHMEGVKLNTGGPTVGGQRFQAGDPTHEAALAVHQAGGDPDAAIDAIDDRLGPLQQHRDAQTLQGIDPDTVRELVPINREIDQLMAQKRLIDDNRGTLPAYKPPGHGYEVELDAQPHEFLDWDKPFSQQSPQVQKALVDVGAAHPDLPRYLQLREQAGSSMTSGMTPTQLEARDAANALWTKMGGGIGRDARGNEMYQALARIQAGQEPNAAATQTHGYGGFGAPDKASAALNAAGVKGIRYLDAGSRSGGKQTSNYVVFNPANMNIIRRYGIGALLPVGAGAGALAGAQSQQ